MDDEFKNLVDRLFIEKDLSNNLLNIVQKYFEDDEIDNISLLKDNQNFVYELLNYLCEYCNQKEEYLSEEELSKIRSFTSVFKGLLKTKENYKKYSSLTNNFKDFYISLDYVSKLYFNDIVNKNNSSNKEHIEKYILTNSFQNNLREYYGGSLLDGKITLESNRGYKNIKSKVQQDAILSIVKNDKCYLNVVADGAGSCPKADKASMEIVENLKNWFEQINEEELKSLKPQEIIKKLNDVLIFVNDKLVKEENGNAYSTVVLSLTLDKYTLIANIGDSTAYTYNFNTDKLYELSELHSLSKGLSYEEARHNPDNNIITKAIGTKLNIFSFNQGLSYKLVRNVGQRIILSSDGVTDLVSENTFKFFFKNKFSAKSIVNYAVNTPDVSDCVKKSDNVSAIVIDLPNDKQKVLCKDK